jgi:hypothetical protein
MAANAVFLDTNGWVALLNARDALHATAARLWRSLGRQGYSILVTDWVVAETGNSLARTAGRSGFTQAVERIRKSSRTRLVFVTPALFERALATYASRPDKTWGLVDCASFVVMQDQGVTEAFTTDRHFEQAGFKPLLPVA